jgi:hypothetical protein
MVIGKINPETGWIQVQFSLKGPDRSIGVFPYRIEKNTQRMDPKSEDCQFSGWTLEN